MELERWSAGVMECWSDGVGADLYVSPSKSGVIFVISIYQFTMIFYDEKES